MIHKIRLMALCLAILLLAGVVGVTGCKSPATTTPTPGGPGGGAIINSDCIVTARIQAIRPQTTGYPWELDVLVQASADVGNLPNPTKDSVGKVITVKTDEDMKSFKVNDVITAHVKYTGDVPRPGITLYIFSIALQVAPGK